MHNKFVTLNFRFDYIFTSFFCLLLSQQMLTDNGPPRVAERILWMKSNADLKNKWPEVCHEKKDVEQMTLAAMFAFYKALYSRMSR